MYHNSKKRAHEPYRHINFRRRKFRHSTKNSNHSSFSKAPDLEQVVKSLSKIDDQNPIFHDKDVDRTYNYSSVDPYADHSCVRPTRSLRDIASWKLASTLFSGSYDADCVNFFIESCPITDAWNIWKRVWHYVLMLERDSPRVFRLFYTKFGSSSSFLCHYLPGVYVRRGSHMHAPRFNHNEDRNSYILLNSLSRKHRFETLYSNAPLDPLVRDLNSISSFATTTLVILNLSGISLKNCFHTITSLQALCYLNISKCNIDNSIFKSLCISMTSTTKLPHLSCLILNGNPRFTCIGDSASTLPPQLYYIESNTGLHDLHHSKSFSQLRDTALLGLTDSLKFKYLVDHHYLPTVNYKDASLILDYRLVNKPYPDTLDHHGILRNETLEHLWIKRRNIQIFHGIQSFIRNTEVAITKVKPSKPIAPKRSKVKHINFNKFFDV